MQDVFVFEEAGFVNRVSRRYVFYMHLKIFSQVFKQVVLRMPL
jgi:hypothetical protein